MPKRTNQDKDSRAAIHSILQPLPSWCSLPLPECHSEDFERIPTFEVTNIGVVKTMNVARRLVGRHRDRR
jgi:hypothetical protein